MTQYTLNFDGLDKLKAAFDKGQTVKVGILAAKNARKEAAGNAEIGVFHEFGSIANNVPARSWLRMPIERPELKTFIASDKIKALVSDLKIEEALTLIGLKAEEIINGAFTSGGFGTWAALKPATIRAKKSSRVLVDTSQLRRSVTSEV